ncbi:MAG: OsmC family protein [Candidatus Brockarchaeota archaeon]|nr:OsmC family protein [Candidatus Brockarchaeota archaeon]
MVAPKRGYSGGSGHFELAAEAERLKGTSAGIKIRDFERIVIDTAPEFGGGGAGPCPVELMLASLAGCVVETAVFLAERAGVRLGDVSSKARATLVRERQNYALAGVEATLEARLLNPGDAEIAERVLGLVEKYCIVANSLRATVPVAVRLNVKA